MAGLGTLDLDLGLRYDAHTPWVETIHQQDQLQFRNSNIDLANQNGVSRGLYDGFYGGKDFQPRIGFPVTPAMLAATRRPWRLYISSYLEGTGTNLRLTLNAPFYSKEIIPSTTTWHCCHEHLRRHVGTATGTSCAAPAMLVTLEPLLRVWIRRSKPAIDDSLAPDYPAPILGRYDLPDWLPSVSRAYHFDWYPSTTRRERCKLPVHLALLGTAPSPFFAKKPDAL